MDEKSTADLELKRQQLLASVVALAVKGSPKTKKKHKDKEREEQQTNVNVSRTETLLNVTPLQPTAEQAGKKKRKKKDNVEGSLLDAAPSFMVPTSTPGPRAEKDAEAYDSSRDNLIKDMMAKYNKKTKKKSM